MLGVMGSEWSPEVQFPVSASFLSSLRLVEVTLGRSQTSHISHDPVIQVGIMCPLHQTNSYKGQNFYHYVPCGQTVSQIKTPYKYSLLDTLVPL